MCLFSFKKGYLCEVFNTDKGSQYTSNIFTKFSNNNDIRITMDGRGRFVDNIWIERLWKQLNTNVYI